MNGKSTVTASLLTAMAIALSAHPAAGTAANAVTSPTTSAGSPGLVSDFNGDGFGDLAVASPRETVGVSEVRVP